MAATLQSLNITLDRTWTQKRCEEQLYEDNLFLAKLKKTDRYTVGEEARVPLHVSRNGGFTPLPEGGGNLNPAGNQGYNKAYYKYRHYHQQVAVQGDAIDGTAGTNAIVAAADEEITRALNDMNRQLTRINYGDGSGLIAQCRTSNTNNVDLNTTSGRIAIERGWLFEGQPIDVGTKTEETSIVNNSIVTAVDDTNWALTVAAGNITTEGTTHYVSQANARSGETSYEGNGLRNVFSESAELGNLSPSAERQWKATVNSTTTTLTIAALLGGRQKIKQKRGKKPNFMLTGLQQERKFYELLQQQVRYGSDSALDAGNAENAKWNGMEIFSDPDCPDEDLYMGHFDHLFIVAIDKPYWQNRVTGGEILTWLQGTDSYGAKLTYRMNLAANRRNDGYRFSSLT